MPQSQPFLWGLLCSLYLGSQFQPCEWVFSSCYKRGLIHHKVNGKVKTRPLFFIKHQEEMRKWENVAKHHSAAREERTGAVPLLLMPSALPKAWWSQHRVHCEIQVSVWKKFRDQIILKIFILRNKFWNISVKMILYWPTPTWDDDHEISVV